VDSLLLRHRVLTPAYRSGSDLDSRWGTDMAITPMGIIHRIHTTRGRPFSGTTGTAFLSGTALSCDILVAFIGRLTGVESTELARKQFRASSHL